MKELTHKEEAAAQFYCDGLTKAESWRRAYNKPNATRGTVTKAVQDVFNRPKVQTRIAELKSQLDDERALVRNEKRMMLAEIARKKKITVDEARAFTVRMKAIDADNVMTGDNAPQKVEVFGNAEILAMVRGKTPPA